MTDTVADVAAELSVPADHRASDGHDGSRLSTTIGQLLQAPEDLT